MSVYEPVSLGALATLAAAIAANCLYLALVVLTTRRALVSASLYAYDTTGDYFASPLTPAVSVLVPVRDEEEHVVARVHGALSLRYPDYEVIVIDRGSSDDTLSLLVEEYDLRPAARALRDGAPSHASPATYLTPRHAGLVVLAANRCSDVEALDLAVRAARNPYVLVVSAGVTLEQNALLAAARPVLDAPEAVCASLGSARLARADGARSFRRQVPQRIAQALAEIEELRAELLVGEDRLRLVPLLRPTGLLFVSRGLVETVCAENAGLRATDLDLALCIARSLRRRRSSAAISMLREPVCSRPAPAGLGQLLRRRAREQQAAARTLGRSRRLPPDRLTSAMLARLLGPPLLLIGTAAVVAARVQGSLPWSSIAALALLAAVLSVAAVSAGAIRSAGSGRSILRPATMLLLLLSPVEGLVYRPLVAAVSTLATLALCRRRPRGAPPSNDGSSSRLLPGSAD